MQGKCQRLAPPPAAQYSGLYVLLLFLISFFIFNDFCQTSYLDLHQIFSVCWFNPQNWFAGRRQLVAQPGGLNVDICPASSLYRHPDQHNMTIRPGVYYRRATGDGHRQGRKSEFCVTGPLACWSSRRLNSLAVNGAVSGRLAGELIGFDPRWLTASQSGWPATQ